MLGSHITYFKLSIKYVLRSIKLVHFYLTLSSRARYLQELDLSFPPADLGMIFKGPELSTVTALGPRVTKLNVTDG
jgi:hypothetical protein